MANADSRPAREGGVAGLVGQHVGVGVGGVADDGQPRGTDGRDGDFLVVVGRAADDDLLPRGKAVGDEATRAARDRVRRVIDAIEFQATHRDRQRRRGELDRTFDAGVTCLVGENVAGKGQLCGRDGRNGELVIVIGGPTDDDFLTRREAIGYPTARTARDRVRGTGDAIEDQATDRGDDRQLEVIVVDPLDPIGGAAGQPADRSAVGLISHPVACG